LLPKTQLVTSAAKCEMTIFRLQKKILASDWLILFQKFTVKSILCIKLIHLLTADMTR
jgi:hypothetical protein